MGGGSEQRVVVNVRELDSLPLHMGQPLCSEFRFDVFQEADGSFTRQYHPVHAPKEYYAEGKVDFSGQCQTISILPGNEHWIDSCAKLCVHAALETLLLCYDRLALHASFVDTPYGGLLFSGVSGIGKSTQAELWVKHESAVQINGDRPILSREKGGWYAHGSPYAGSSMCYVNRSLPIRAIFMLEQGSRCSVYRLPVAEAFRRLYAGTAINSWDSDFVSRACDLLTRLAAEVPVYHLTCTPDRDAIEAVKSVL